MSKRPCPKCGDPMDRQSTQCAACRGPYAKRSVMTTGYVRVWVPGHPVANADGYALEHRLVLHDAGVLIPDGAHVHHLNGDKTDNRRENLEVLTAGDHHRHHIAVAGRVVNQFGEWPVLTAEERRDKQRARCRAWRERRRRP